MEDLFEHHIDPNEIAFSPLDFKPEMSFDQADHLYAVLMDKYDRISGFITDEAFSGVIRTDGNTSFPEALLNTISSLNQESSSELYYYFQTYNHLIDALNDWLQSDSHLYSWLLEKGYDERSFLLWFPPYHYWYDSQLYVTQYSPQFLLQAFCVTQAVTQELMSFCRHIQKVPLVTKLAYEGCKKMRFTWKDYFDYLYITRDSIVSAIIYNAIKLATQERDAKQIATSFTKAERYGVAFADYAYGNNKPCQGTKITITPVTVSSQILNDITSNYDNKTMCLNLEDAYGMKVALFDNTEIGHCLAFAGTRIDFRDVRSGLVTIENILTDFIQAIYKPTPAYFASVGIVNKVLSTFSNEKLSVFGHSLGGGFMRFSCAANNDVRIDGYGYNAAGLSAVTCDILSNHLPDQTQSNLSFIAGTTDFASKTGKYPPNTKYVVTKGMGILEAHKIDTLNKLINNPLLFC